MTFVAKEELKERRESQPHRVFKLKQDRDKLKRALQAEAEGILAWVVAGAEAFHKGDLQSPKKITVAKEEYRKSSHPLSDFVDACCTKGAGLTVAGAEFYRAYQLYHDHARTPRADRLGPVEFGVVAKVDFDWGKSNGQMCYRNVGLIHVYEQHAEGEAWKQ